MQIVPLQPILILTLKIKAFFFLLFFCFVLALLPT